MPIPVSCSCGKKFAAPDKFAGKRVKCPACAEPIQIPAGSSASGGTADPATAGQASKPKALKVACSCGKTLMVKAELAGKAVKCPGCGNTVRIGAPKQAAAAPPGSGIDDLLDEVDLGVSTTGHRCPECRTDLQPDDIICVRCGYNLETGKKLQTRTSRKVDPIAELSGKPPKDGKKGTSGSSLELGKQTWLIVALVMVIPTAILWFINPSLAVFTLFILSSLANLGASVWILVIAFQDSVLQGVLCLLVPCYMLYYIVTNWEETKAATGILAVAIVAFMAANALLPAIMPAA